MIIANQNLPKINEGSDMFQPYVFCPTPTINLTDVKKPSLSCGYSKTKLPV